MQELPVASSGVDLSAFQVEPTTACQPAFGPGEMVLSSERIFFFIALFYSIMKCRINL
jgi:hypothetical protein